ncbi:MULTISPECIES: hypothetical protein [Roseobacteraceae]|jgi:Ni/Co efflux regulator RcnB|uniref:DUF4177 domain-containing protein n=1 Tax=Pseudosulfitobacter pseudonitzschiae TaxID=1402135 RepID=A0A221K445_9RHOB|nr:MULTISPECIES: hypothetical protein [Roseobacteraceae]ASM73778.1 hypothetical protein SULPSESMR1_02997 [Pseudosulfitobacter pseudonitzschiae]
MKHILLSLACAAMLAAPAAAQAADCFADYKAKKDAPLRLHYGVAQVSACDRGTAQADLKNRLAANGWTLLQIVSVFGPEGLDQRKDSAGQYFLRF